MCQNDRVRTGQYPLQALVFDLDDTLIPEPASLTAAFSAAGRLAEERGVEAPRLREAVLRLARELWHASPVYDFCRRLGIASWEALSSDFPGDGAELAFLRGWAPEYRLLAWQRALQELGEGDEALARDLAEAFRSARRLHHEPFPEAAELLQELGKRFRLALITNGPADLQRDKLRVSGLARFFEQPLISGELGFGKPDRRIFELALQRLGVEASRALMIGDNPERDIAGARSAGMGTVWIMTKQEAEPAPVYGDYQVRSLTELRQLLAAIS